MPQVRSYSMRRVGESGVELEVVKHLDGLASTWSTSVQPGDEGIWRGASEAWLAPISDHPLMIADNSALPAEAATLDALPPKVEVDVIGIDADKGHLPQIPVTSDSLATSPFLL